MKKLVFAIALIPFFLTSCSSTSFMVADDGYYTSSEMREISNREKEIKRQAAQQAQATRQTQAVSNYQQDTYVDNGQYDQNYYSESEQYIDGGNTYTDNYFDESDYYDYAYTARLRRFYGVNTGFGYYDPYFTNLYSYTHNPNFWGVSIYMGYDFWWGSRWGFSPFFYSPHYWWGFPYSGYYCGDYYYNSFDRNRNFSYGPRSSMQGGISAVNRTGIRGDGSRSSGVSLRETQTNEESFGERYERAIQSSGTSLRGGGTSGASGSAVSNARQNSTTSTSNPRSENAVTRPANNSVSAPQRTNNAANASVRSNNTNSQSIQGNNPRNSSPSSQRRGTIEPSNNVRTTNPSSSRQDNNLYRNNNSNVRSSTPVSNTRPSNSYNNNSSPRSTPQSSPSNSYNSRPSSSGSSSSYSRPSSSGSSGGGVRSGGSSSGGSSPRR